MFFLHYFTALLIILTFVVFCSIFLFVLHYFWTKIVIYYCFVIALTLVVEFQLLKCRFRLYHHVKFTL